MSDPKVRAIVDWLLPLLTRHGRRGWPFVVGLSGVQGSGKSTLVRLLQRELIDNGVRTAQLSLDDLYLTRKDQQHLIDSSPDNALLGSRGQFGTHDLELAETVFQSLGIGSTVERDQSEDDSNLVALPSYDKSCHDGLGDRAPPNDWPRVATPIDCLILEGWGVGFRALGPERAALAWQEARAKAVADPTTSGQLARHERHHVLQLDRALSAYNASFLGPHRHIQALVVLEPERLLDVYQWRLEQEHQLRQTKPGMSDEQVTSFVDRYFPSYELYFEKMCTGFFDPGDEGSGRQINLTIDRRRQLTEVQYR